MTLNDFTPFHSNGDIILMYVNAEFSLMNDILDDIKETKRKPFFARCSIFSSIGAICGFAFIMNMITSTIQVNQSLEQPPILLIRITQILFVTSVIFITISYLKREPKSWTKGIATFLSILIVSLFAVAILFYFFIESSR